MLGKSPAAGVDPVVDDARNPAPSCGAAPRSCTTI